MNVQHTRMQLSSTVVTKGNEINRTENNSNTEYSSYLQSRRWRTLVKAARMRAKGKCEICLRADGAECAHLTYERIFNERLTDVLWVCIKCHRELDNRW